MNIKGNLIDYHFCHINQIRCGQVFITKDNNIYMKVEMAIDDNREENYENIATNLRNGKIVEIHPEANLRLLNCNLNIEGFVQRNKY